MASYTGATLAAVPVSIETDEYEPLLPGQGVDPKRYLNVAGEAVPIQ